MNINIFFFFFISWHFTCARIDVNCGFLAKMFAEEKPLSQTLQSTYVGHNEISEFQWFKMFFKWLQYTASQMTMLCHLIWLCVQCVVKVGEMIWREKNARTTKRVRHWRHQPYGFVCIAHLFIMSCICKRPIVIVCLLGRAL